MAMTLEQTIAKQEGTWVSRLLANQTFWVIIALIVACIYLSIAAPIAFPTAKNFYNITRNFTFTAIIALGMTFVIITGGIDLSVGSILCLTSMVLAVTMHAGWSLEFGILFSVLSGIAVGLFNGFFVAYLRFPPFVVTLGMLSIARSIAMVVSSNQTLFQFGPDHDRLLALGGGAIFGVSNPVDLHESVVVAICDALSCCASRALAATFSPSAATSMLPPSRVFQCAGSRSRSSDSRRCRHRSPALSRPAGSGQSLLISAPAWSFQVIAAAVIGGASLVGGAGTALGALVGAALLEVIRNSLGSCLASTPSGKVPSSAASSSSPRSSTGYGRAAPD